MKPDPKTGKRIVDPTAVRAALLAHPTCAACGQRAATAHHIIQKGAPHFGDDVPGNIVGLCGSGTSGCHGAIHGTPYSVPWTAGSHGKLGGYERRDAEWVGRRVGATILRSRPDVIHYVIDKLGEFAGEFYLRRFYSIEVVNS